MKYIFLATAFLFSIIATMAQESKTLKLDTCYALARQQYPLIKQKGLIDKTKDYNVSNASKGYLPQVNFNGQATYQSDVTSVSLGGLPKPFNTISFPTPPKDQFNVHGEVDQ